MELNRFSAPAGGNGSRGAAHGSPSQIASSPAEVFAVIHKMFSNPIPSPAPIGSEYMPSGTETLHNKLEEDYVRYSPVMWADPLLPYSMTIDAAETIYCNPATGVDVNNSQSGWRPLRTLSALGMQMKAIVDADLSATGAIRGMMPVPGLRDQNSLARLMLMSNIERAPSLDEAAIVRLLLLQTATMDPVQQVYVSSAVNEISINTYVQRKDCSLEWTKAPDTSDNLQIGTQANTSVLYYRTIDEYIALIAGNTADYILDKDGNSVDTSDVVFVPVKLCWRWQSWLMPYILSFTTTAWWNHAITINVTYTNTVEEKTDGKVLKAGFMPKSSTVYIPGSYRKICLVVTDSTRAIFPDDMGFAVCDGVVATHAGDTNFAKYAYSYLGRMVTQDIRSMMPRDITMALNCMTEFMCTSSEFRSLQVRASVLATSRFNGFGVYPNPDAPPVAKGTGELQRNNLYGPKQFNAKNEIKISDYTLPDLAEMTSDDRLSTLKGHQSWRTDPLGYFAYGQVDCKKDAAHFPAMWKYTKRNMQYQLSKSETNLRILRACGIFAQDTGSDRHMLQNPVDVFNTTIAYGSLVLGLTNWAMVELGATMFEHNCIGKRWRSIPDDYLELWPALTGNFVIRSSEFEDRLVDDEKWRRFWGWTMNQATLVDNVDLGWMDTHYCWNVPWWYVSAIAGKFGHTFKCKTEANGELLLDEGTMDGWLVEASKSAQYDLSLLTSSCQYEIKVRRNKPAYFDILTPTSNGRNEAYNFVSWQLNSLMDHKKTMFKSPTKTNAPDTSGVVELNVIVFPSARIGKMRTSPRALVSPVARVDGRDESTYPFISRGLKWPDLCLDCLLKGGISAVPHLLTGDYTDAITGRLSVLMGALNSWNNSNNYSGKVISKQHGVDKSDNVDAGGVFYSDVTIGDCCERENESSMSFAEECGSCTFNFDWESGSKWSLCGSG